MSVKTKIKTISWSVLGLGCIVLLVAAMKTRGLKTCAGININIKGAMQYMFINKADVMEVLNNNNINTGKTLDDIDLKRTEERLKQNAWIKTAELYFDNNQMLHADISEREPIARVFTVSGNSFYIDSTGLRLPVNENATARVIVFTSFPSDKKILSKLDSLVLNDVKILANYITADSFLNKQTAQINITQQRMYEITPVVGDQLIKIGDADNLSEKFAKLLAFYKQVWSKVGFEKYSVIDVEYEGQVVAVKRGEGYTISDTAKAMKQFKTADTKLNKVMNDTIYSAPVLKMNNDSVKTITVKQKIKETSIAKMNTANAKPPVKNKTLNNNNKQNETRKPKAVMKKKD